MHTSLPPVDSIDSTCTDRITSWPRNTDCSGKDPRPHDAHCQENGASPKIVGITSNLSICPQNLRTVDIEISCGRGMSVRSHLGPHHDGPFVW